MGVCGIVSDMDGYKIESESEIRTSMMNPPREQAEVAKLEAIEALRECDGFMLVAVRVDPNDPNLLEHDGFFSTGPKMGVAALMIAVNLYEQQVAEQIHAHMETLEDDAA